MTTRVTPDPIHLSEFSYVCSHSDDHEACRQGLELLLSTCDGTWPGFDRRYGCDGSLHSLTAPMLCGCTFIALAVQ